MSYNICATWKRPAARRGSGGNLKGLNFRQSSPSERTELTRPPSLYHLLALWPLTRCLVSWPLVPSSAKRGEKHLPIIWHSSINWSNICQALYVVVDMWYVHNKFLYYWYYLISISSILWRSIINTAPSHLTKYSQSTYLLNIHCQNILFHHTV